MVARIEIEGISVAAHERNDRFRRGAARVREAKIENGVMYVTYDPLDTAEKEAEERCGRAGTR
jgi:hypothetical protein